MRPVVRGATLLTMLPASVRWLHMTLAKRHGVTISRRTVERDLRELEGAGLIVREHGIAAVPRWRRIR